MTKASASVCLAHVSRSARKSTLIASEIIAGSNGIGWMILDAGRFLRSDYAFVGILVIGLTGILIDRMLVLVERRVVHWAGR